MEGRETGNSDERKQGNLGERKSRVVGQSQNLSQNLSQKRRNGSQESGAVQEGSKVQGQEGAISAEAEAGGSEEGTPRVVRGPEGDAQGVLLSVATLGPGFEATSP